MIVLDSFLIDFFFFYIHHMCYIFVQLSLGAVQSHGLQKPILSNRNFHGCLENLLYNDLNLLYLAKKNNHQVSAVVSCCVASSLRFQTTSQSTLVAEGYQNIKSESI